MSKRVVRTAEQAAAALRDAQRWLTQPGSGPVGAQRWKALRDAKRVIRDNPYIGRALGQEGEHPGHRQYTVSGFRVIYRLDPDTGDTRTVGIVRIVAVLAPGQP